MGLSYPRQRSRPSGRYPVRGTKTTINRTYFNGALISVASPTVVVNPVFPRGTQACSDYVTVVPPFSDHPLDITNRRLIKQGFVNGSMLVPPTAPKTGVQSFISYSNWSDTVLADAYKTHFPALPNIDFNYYLTRALGKLNPKKPVFDSVNFMLELRDFPSMLRHAGDLFSHYNYWKWVGRYRKYRHLSFRDYATERGGGPQMLSELHLAYSFGWRPMVNDLLALTNMADAGIRALKLLTDAKQGKRLRVSLGSKKGQFLYQENNLIINQNGGLQVTCRTLLDERVWATAHAQAKDLSGENWYSRLMGTLDSHAKWRVDVDDLLGKGLSWSSLWKSYPWTWLIDYFTNVGDMLEASRGVLPFDIIDLCLMAEQTATETSTVQFNYTGLRYDPHEIRFSRKQRKTYSAPTPQLSISLNLDVGKTVNLLALVTLGKLTNLARTA